MRVIDGDGTIHSFTLDVENTKTVEEGQVSCPRLLWRVDQEDPQEVEELLVEWTEKGCKLWQADSAAVATLDDAQAAQLEDMAALANVQLVEKEPPTFGDDAETADGDDAPPVELLDAGEEAHAGAGQPQAERAAAEDDLLVDEDSKKWVKIWSVSRARWIFGTVISEDSKTVTVQYIAPEGLKEKKLKHGHRHLEEAHCGAEGPSREDTDWLVCGRYTMHMLQQDVMGEGSSSICRRGVDTVSGRPVAIKIYKLTPDFAESPTADQASGEEDWNAITALKFKRQIEVLQELQKPLERPAESSLWSEQMEGLSSKKLFMQMLDYSKDSNGNPGKDPTDDLLYLITELSECSLLEYLARRKTRSEPLSREGVRQVAAAVVQAAAGLHAKGYVHLDLKPENMMVFDNCLKLIDVDGCIKIGTSVSLADPSLSCSPVYCSPEWGQFCNDESNDPQIPLRPQMDAWGVGMTLAELVTLEPLLLSKYTSFQDKGEEAGLAFMDWLSARKEPPCQEAIAAFDKDLADFLSSTLLVCDSTRRSTLAQALAHPYLAAAFDKKGRLRRNRTFDELVGADSEAPARRRPSKKPPPPAGGDPDAEVPSDVVKKRDSASRPRRSSARRGPPRGSAA